MISSPTLTMQRFLFGVEQVQFSKDERYWQLLRLVGRTPCKIIVNLRISNVPSMLSVYVMFWSSGISKVEFLEVVEEE